MYFWGILPSNSVVGPQIHDFLEVGVLKWKISISEPVILLLPISYSVFCIRVFGLFLTRSSGFWATFDYKHYRVNTYCCKTWSFFMLFSPNQCFPEIWGCILACFRGSELGQILITGSRKSVYSKFSDTKSV